jgi:hypothetical protein
MIQKFLILCSLISLSLILSLIFIQPIAFLNDEWITANQLHQLSEGSQILYNEGKYGSYENGTPYRYFEEKNNSLPYTSYLPLISVPFLWLIVVLGNTLPYFVTVAFTVISLLLFILINNGGNNSNLKTKKFKTNFILLFGIFLFFLINLFFYDSTLFSEKDSKEILGVIFYHICLYGILSVIIFLINLELFNTNLKAFFGTVISMCCSSALFWTTTMKDHLDAIFFVALLIFILILHVKTKDTLFAISTFILSGLILWIRPEFGAILFIFLVLIYWPLTFPVLNRTNRTQCIIHVLSPFAVLFGALPLLLNNYLVMGNFLKFPWQLSSKYAIINESFNISPIHTLTNNVQSDLFGGVISKIIILFIERLTPKDDILSGLFSAFFYPELLKVPVFGLSPIFLLAMLLLPFLQSFLKIRFNAEDKQILVILATFCFAGVIAYISSITDFGVSAGVYPDVRYLSPLYFPLTLIGLIILMKMDFSRHAIISIIKYIGQIIIFGSLFELLIVAYLYPEMGYSDFFLWSNILTTVLVFCALGLTFVLFVLTLQGKLSDKYSYISISILIALPFLWQLSQLIILNFSGNDVDQYPPLLPAIRELFIILTKNIGN